MSLPAQREYSSSPLDFDEFHALETDCTLLAGVKDEVVIVQKRWQTGLLKLVKTNHIQQCKPAMIVWSVNQVLWSFAAGVRLPQDKGVFPSRQYGPGRNVAPIATQSAYRDLDHAGASERQREGCLAHADAIHH